MKNLTNTLTKAETEVIDLIRDQAYASHMGMLYADTDRCDYLNRIRATTNTCLPRCIRKKAISC